MTQGSRNKLFILRTPHSCAKAAYSVVVETVAADLEVAAAAGWGEGAAEEMAVAGMGEEEMAVTAVTVGVAAVAGVDWAGVVAAKVGGAAVTGVLRAVRKR